MPIRFQCPNPSCGKVLTVKDHLAGKKAACPSCRRALTIPQATAAAANRPPAAAPTTDPASAQTTTFHAGDAEDVAASLLADEPKPAGPAAPPKTVRFTCEYCDEAVEVDIALAGLRAPCPNPECRRIIKVPKPQGEQKVDWRNTAPGAPAAARRPTEPAPEGAWGSTSKTLVSKEAMEEAGALPDQRRERLTGRQWAVRGLLAASAAGAAFVGVLLVLGWLGGKRQEQLLGRAMAAVGAEGDGFKLKGPEAAIVHLWAARYHLGRGDQNSVRPEKGDAGAWNQFGLARGKLSAAGEANAECDALLIELALAQLDLGGGPEQVEEGKRMGWPEARKEVGQTLLALRRPEAQAEGLRRVARRLIERGQEALAEDLVNQLGAGPGVSAVAALEFRRAGQTEKEQKWLKQVVAAYPPPPAKGERKAPLPPLTTDVVALLVVNRRDQSVPEVKGRDQRQAKEVGLVAGRAWGEGHHKALPEARKLTSRDAQIEALAAIAGAPGDAAAVKETVAVAALVAGNGAPPWAILRLVEAGLKAGVDDKTLLALASRIGDRERLRGWAQLQVMRSRLEREGGKAEESLLELVEKNTLASGVAHAELAEHNARKAGGTEKEVDGWDESVRPFGYVGVALGLQGKD